MARARDGVCHSDAMHCSGYTPLGSGLEAKCIIPFAITPARNNFLKKPVLVSLNV